jgi:hypothetical protein
MFAQDACYFTEHRSNTRLRTAAHQQRSLTRRWCRYTQNFARPPCCYYTLYTITGCSTGVASRGTVFIQADTQAEWEHTKTQCE